MAPIHPEIPDPDRQIAERGTAIPSEILRAVLRSAHRVEEAVASGFDRVEAALDRGFALLDARLAARVEANLDESPLTASKAPEASEVSPEPAPASGEAISRAEKKTTRGRSKKTTPKRTEG